MKASMAVRTEPRGSVERFDGTERRSSAGVPATVRKKRARHYDVAREYLRQFPELSESEATSFFTSRAVDPFFSFFRSKTFRDPSWTTRTHASVEPWEAEVALFGGVDRIAPMGVERTRLLIVDIDVRLPMDEQGTEERGGDENVIDAFAAPGSRSAKAAATRRWKKQASIARASLARPVVDEIAARFPPTHVEKSARRGLHLVYKLADFAPVEEVERIGRALVAGLELPPGVAVEVFPRSGNLCAMPLMGASRRVGTDLEKPDTRKRMDAVAPFLAEPGIEIDDIAAALDLDLDEGAPEATTESIAFDAVAVDGPREVVEGQLKGPDFAVRCLDLLTGGMRNDETWEAVRRLYACARYLGYDEDQTRTALENWIDQPIHDCDHAHSRRKKFSGLLTAQRKHFERGVMAGRCVAGRMSSKELRQAFDRLLARENPRVQNQAEETEPCNTTQPNTRNTTTRTTSRSRSASSRVTRATSPRNWGHSVSWSPRDCSASMWPRKEESTSFASSREGAPNAPCAFSSSCTEEVDGDRGGSVVRLLQGGTSGAKQAQPPRGETPLDRRPTLYVIRPETIGPGLATIDRAVTLRTSGPSRSTKLAEKQVGGVERTGCHPGGGAS